MSLRRKPSAAMAALTFSVVSGRTPSSPLTTRDTVLRLTPARRATSRMVGRMVSPRTERFLQDNVVLSSWQARRQCKPAERRGAPRLSERVEVRTLRGDLIPRRAALEPPLDPGQEVRPSPPQVAHARAHPADA